MYHVFSICHQTDYHALQGWASKQEAFTKSRIRHGASKVLASQSAPRQSVVFFCFLLALGEYLHITFGPYSLCEISLLVQSRRIERQRDLWTQGVSLGQQCTAATRVLGQDVSQMRDTSTDCMSWISRSKAGMYPTQTLCHCAIMLTCT